MIASKIVHIHFNDTGFDDYFSSIKAVFKYYTTADIGLQYRSLVNALHDTGVYTNKRVTVKVGKIKSSTSKPNTQ